MNSRRIGGVTLAVVIAAGLGVLANTAFNGANAADATGTARTSTAPSAAPSTGSDIVLAPGSAGPVTVGMTKHRALDTGLFHNDVPAIVDGCPSLPLVWKAPFDAALDVQTLPDGEVASIGVRAEGPATAEGLGVGSTYAAVQARYAGAKAVPAGYGQSGVLVQDGDAWIGFLFDTTADLVTPDTEVTFVEVTEGEAPSLMRDGC